MISSHYRRACSAYFRRIRWMVFVCLLTFATGVAWSSWHPEFRIQQPPSIRVNEMSLNSRSVCLEEAAYIGRVDPALLQAIVTVESGEHPYAFGWFDKTGVRRFYKAASYRDAVVQFDKLEQQRIRFDVGLAQVNSRNLAILQRRTGVPPIRALDPCANLRLAAVILREQIRIHGPTWRAVAGYNGALAYVPKVHRVYCSRAPDASGCRPSLSLSQLLCEPIPVSQTARYYRAFFKMV